MSKFPLWTNFELTGTLLFGARIWAPPLKAQNLKGPLRCRYVQGNKMQAYRVISCPKSWKWSWFILPPSKFRERFRVRNHSIFLKSTLRLPPNLFLLKSLEEQGEGTTGRSGDSSVSVQNNHLTNRTMIRSNGTYSSWSWPKEASIFGIDPLNRFPWRSLAV